LDIDYAIKHRWDALRQAQRTYARRSHVKKRRDCSLWNLWNDARRVMADARVHASGAFRVSERKAW
jgi:hypothetical protein